MCLGGPQWKYNERHESSAWKNSGIVWHTLLDFYYFFISLSAAFAKQIHLAHRGSLLLQIRLFQTNCVRKREVSQDVRDACQVSTLRFFCLLFFFHSA